jgi:hypothetical protein
LAVVHGTSERNAWKIAQSGFSNLSLLDAGYYGRGTLPFPLFLQYIYLLIL